MSQKWMNYDWERLQSGSPLLNKSADLELNIMAKAFNQGAGK